MQTVKINFRTGCQDFLIFLIKIFETPLMFYFRVSLIKRSGNVNILQTRGHLTEGM